MDLLELLTKNKATSKEKIGGGFIGRIKISYPELLQILGKPHFDGSGDNKVDAEWAYMLDRDSKTVVTVYNYKTDGPVHYETNWHIGGHGDRELIRSWIIAVFKRQMNK